jgi:hypothetical protein
MKTIAAICTLATVALFAAATFQGGKQEGQKKGEPADASKKAHDEMMPMVTPGKEHEPLKALAGTWDAAMKMQHGPDAPPMESNGVETATLTCGGLWLASDYKSEMMGQSFSGHGVCGWDAEKKKYTSIWVDSMSTSMMHMEGTYDPATRTLTMTGEMPTPMGEKVPVRTTDQFKDADTRVFTMYGRGPDGKEVVSLTIHYTRKK